MRAARRTPATQHTCRRDQREGEGLGSLPCRHFSSIFIAFWLCEDEAQLLIFFHVSVSFF